MKTVMITGVCGVGKSTITRELAKQFALPWNDYADLMLELMENGDRDIFPRLNWNERRRIYDEVDKALIDRVSRTKTHPLFLLENHLSVVQDGKIVPLDFTPYDKYLLAGLVVVEGDPQEIAKRRTNDSGRQRLSDDISVITAQQEVNRQIAGRLARELHIPLGVVESRESAQVLKETVAWMRALTDFL